MAKYNVLSKSFNNQKELVDFFRNLVESQTIRTAIVGEPAKYINEVSKNYICSDMRDGKVKGKVEWYEVGYADFGTICVYAKLVGATKLHQFSIQKASKAYCKNTRD